MLFRILPRYLLWEVLVPTAFSLATLTFILLIQAIFTRADDLASGLSFASLLEVLWGLIPSLWILAVPMSVLIGVLLGVGRMTVDNEIKAMRTHGVNLFPLFIPTLLFGLLLTIFSLFNSLYYAPRMLDRVTDMLDSMKSELFRSMEPGHFIDKFRIKGCDTVVYYEKKDPVTGDMLNVYFSIEGTPKAMQDAGAAPAKKTEPKPKKMITLPGGKQIEDKGASPESMRTLILSETGKIELAPTPGNPASANAPTSSSATATAAPLILTLKNGTMHFMRDRNDPRYSVTEFEQAHQMLETASKDMSSKERARTMTLPQLLQGMRAETNAAKARPKAPEQTPGEKRAKTIDLPAVFFAELCQRVSIAMATFCFVLIGLPLAIYVHPSGKSSGISLAFALILAYYVIMHWGVMLTRQGGAGFAATVGPYIIFLPNLILLAGGAAMMRATIRR